MKNPRRARPRPRLTIPRADDVEGIVATILIPRTKRVPMRFVRTADGQTFALATYNVDLMATWDGFNSRARERICQFAGLNPKDLKAAIAAKRKADKQREHDRAVEKLKQQAGRLGYRLTRKGGTA